MAHLRKVNQFQPATLSRPNGKEDTKNALKSTLNKSTSTNPNSSSKSSSAAPQKCDLCSEKLPETEAAIKYKTASFHVRCFKCSACGASMRNKTVYEGEGLGGSKVPKPSSETPSSSEVSVPVLFCEPCYKARLDHCVACGKLIEEGRIVLLGTEKLHHGCFTCAGCKAPLEGYIEEEVGEGQPPKPAHLRRFCEPCYRAHCLPGCAFCGSPLRVNEAEGTMEQLVGPDGRLYHPECFRCDGCEGSLDAQGEGGVSGGRRRVPFGAKKDQASSNLDSPTTAVVGVVNKKYFPVGGRKLCFACAKTAEASGV